MRRFAFGLSLTLLLACGTDAGSVAEPGSALPQVGPTRSQDPAAAPSSSASDPARPPADEPTRDASVDAAPIDTSALAPCDPNGELPIDLPNARCLNFRPIDTGAASSEPSASYAHFAVRPTAGPAAKLVLFIPGTNGKPQGPLRADPKQNLFGAAIRSGHAMLSVAYRNDVSVGQLCRHQDGCYWPTRQSMILGGTFPGSKTTYEADQSVAHRTAAALRYLAAGDPEGGWGAYLLTTDPAVAPIDAIDWSKIIVVGHSQGGGHAAAIAKMKPVAGVLTLASVCDCLEDGSGVTWTNGNDGQWATNPATFIGMATPTYFVDGAVVGGDTTCWAHPFVWENLGIAAANQHDDAAECGVTGDTHGQSVVCKDNFQAWRTYLSSF